MNTGVGKRKIVISKPTFQKYKIKKNINLVFFEQIPFDFLQNKPFISISGSGIDSPLFFFSVDG